MLRALFTTDVASTPASLQFAVCYTVPVMNAVGEQLDEPPLFAETGDASGYSRGEVSTTSASWGVSDFGEMYNVSEISIGTPTIEWGALYGWALVDPLTDETIVVGELTDPLEPVIGTELKVPVASLVIGLYG